MDYHIGQSVALAPRGNMLRRRPTNKVGTVTKIGSKYITVETEHDTLLFDKTTMLHVIPHPPDYQLYPCEQALLDAQEHEELLRYLHKAINPSNPASDSLSLEQLRQIKLIIEGENKDI
jgi:hypothetical protein